MIYRLRYCNKEGVEARVDIQKGSSTPVIEVEGTERPFILSYNNDKGNKSGMFLSSSADIEIYETTDFNIDNLKTSNETELSVTHYINNVISWQGFIIPDFFSIEVRSNPVITMTASDRLGTLKNVTLSDLSSIISLRELAILCLNKTGLTLPLRTMADFNNGTGINDFFNSKILTQRLSDTKGRSISCYDILSSILTASNSFLVQRTGAWHIINKIQHEAGSGKLYTDATSFINWSDVIFNFSDISIGGRRTIIPVASTVGVFHEFGGGKLHPDNYDFAQGTAGWVASGGYSINIEDREIKGYSKSGSNWIADFGQATTKKRLKGQNLLNFPLTNLDTAPYAKATFPLITTNTSSVDISMDMSVVGMPWYRTGVVVLAEKGTTRLAFSQSSGKFEPYDPQLATNPGYPDFMINLFLPVQGSAEDKSYYDASTKSMKFSGKLEDSDLTGWNITIRLYGYYSLQLGSRVDFPMFFSFANVSFSNTNEIPKGNIYKTEKDGDFTKAHDIDTSIFADYITYGLNGFFYEYPIDDTSSLYDSANELTSKWTAYNDTVQLPLLQHITRQRSRLFSVAHDLLSAEIEATDFDPLAIFVACNKRHTVVSAQFDFFKSNLSVELEEIDFQSASARDFIYSYFGDGESGIKSIGGISGGAGGGGTGGGLTPEQIEILSFWKKDPDRENTIFTEMNAYSKLELSAYGAGDGGGGGGGSDYERLDTWASYDSSRAGWVLSAFLGNDLNTRVTAIDGRVSALENSSGGESHTHANKAQLDLITQSNIDVLAKLSIVNGNLQINGNAYATGELSAYGVGTGGGGGGGGIIETVYGYGNLGQTFNNANLTDTFNAYTINQINTRLIAVESGSALTVNTTGTGNAITSISKSGSVITANKDLTFSLSTHTHTKSDITDWFVFNSLANTAMGASGFFAGAFVAGGTAYFGSYSGSGNYGTGIVGRSNKLYFQTLENSTLQGWNEIYHTGNFNPANYLPLTGGTLTGNLTAPTFIGALTGNAASSTKLQTARTIAGVSFDGTDNIAIPFANLSSKPTTLAGYEITDAYTKTEVNSALNLKANLASPTFTGVVGIGVPSAYSKLHIGGTGVDTPIGDITMSRYWVDETNTRGSSIFHFFDSNLQSDMVVIGVSGAGAGGSFNAPNQINQAKLSILASGNVGIGTTTPQYKLDVSGTGRFTGTVTAPTFIGSLSGNASTATKLQTARTIWGQSFDGSGNVTGALSGATTIAASTSVASPKVIFNAAGWSMEQVGSELQMKHNNIIKMRFTSAGSIVATNEITAFA